MLLKYILKRMLIAIPTLLVASMIVFFTIQLPPGSFLDSKIQQMQQEGQVDMTEIESLRQRYHFDRPIYVQYFYWMVNFCRGDLGRSFETDEEVSEILKDLVPTTIVISLFALLFSWSIAIPFGVIAAVKRNTIWDYTLTFCGLTAMATPGFLLALVLMVLMQKIWPDYDPTGLLSQQYVGQPWSMNKWLDLIGHLILPILILGVAGTAGMIRILRSNLIDELKKQYVLCAMARGLHPALVIIRYPLRVAINPFISSVGTILPTLISGSAIISIVLGLPTLGPKLLQAIMSQDTYLASSCLFIQVNLAILGILLSDILLSFVDPRIKFGAK